MGKEQIHFYASIACLILFIFLAAYNVIHWGFWVGPIVVSSIILGITFSRMNETTNSTHNINQSIGE